MTVGTADPFSATKRSGRIPELDGLRGIAIGLVLIQHYFVVHTSVRAGGLAARLQSPLRLAWTGVDLFFVLSGFLIGGILLDARRSTNYFQVFYRRRFFRIIPLYACCVATTFIASRFASIAYSNEWSWLFAGRLPWLPYCLFVQNFWMAHHNAIGVFPLAVTWSLAVEEQFYLSLPLLVRLLNTRLLVRTLAAGIIMAPILRMLLYQLWPLHTYAWYMLMPCRADALLFGVLAAIIIRDERWSSIIVRRGWALKFIVLPVLLSGIVVLNHKAAGIGDYLMLSVGYTWIATFYTCIILCVYIWRDGLIAAAIRLSPLRWLGAIAYGAYLVHEAVLGVSYGLFSSLPPRASNLPQLGITLAALCLTLVICKLSWELFEKPLVRIGHRLDYKFVEENVSDPQGNIIVEGKWATKTP